MGPIWLFKLSILAFYKTDFQKSMGKKPKNQISADKDSKVKIVKQLFLMLYPCQSQALSLQQNGL